MDLRKQRAYLHLSHSDSPKLVHCGNMMIYILKCSFIIGYFSFGTDVHQFTQDHLYDCWSNMKPGSYFALEFSCWINIIEHADEGNKKLDHNFLPMQFKVTEMIFTPCVITQAMSLAYSSTSCLIKGPGVCQELVLRTQDVSHRAVPHKY